ncbi:hypothetical protein HX744_16750 [Pseudonocardia sp. ICBG1122]|nr:hypothetical protein [Pseudonocardia pini]
MTDGERPGNGRAGEERGSRSGSGWSRGDDERSGTAPRRRRPHASRHDRTRDVATTGDVRASAAPRAAPGPTGGGRDTGRRDSGFRGDDRSDRGPRRDDDRRPARDDDRRSGGTGRRDSFRGGGDRGGRPSTGRDDRRPYRDRDDRGPRPQRDDDRGGRSFRDRDDRRSSLLRP